MRLAEVSTDISCDSATGRWSVPGMASEQLYQRVCANVRSGRRFAFARYGDGEWLCMAGADGGNCDGHRYFKDLGERLLVTVAPETRIDEPDYIMGLQPLSALGMRETVAALSDPTIDWENSDALHDANIEDGMAELAESLFDVSVILVGPERLAPLAAEWTSHVVVPEVDCWGSYDFVFNAVMKNLRQAPTVVFVCFAMGAEVLIHELWKATEHLGTHGFIDMGSAFDPHVGHTSRSYHGRISWKESPWT